MKYVIFGVGSNGYTAYETLKDTVDIVGFADSFKKETSFDGNHLPVFSPEEISDDTTVIIATGQHHWKEIEKKLDELNLKHVTFDQFVFDRYRSELEEIEGYLDDDFSKDVLRNVISARCENDYSRLEKLISDNQYFGIPKMEPALGHKECFVDAGAYVGDTVERYIFDRIDSFDRIYAFEPGPKQFKALLRRSERLTEEWALEPGTIQCVQAALSDKNKKIAVNYGGDSLASCFISESASDEEEYMQAYSLDEFIAGKEVGFLKADVEGEEVNLLLGAKETIRRYRPRLAICLYHNPYHFIQIPKFIKEICPEYKMMIRHYTLNQTETVLYCYL